MDRRHEVDYAWRPSIEWWDKVRAAACALGRAGLVTEIVCDENSVYVYAARRLKSGKKADE